MTVSHVQVPFVPVQNLAAAVDFSAAGLARQGLSPQKAVPQVRGVTLTPVRDSTKVQKGSLAVGLELRGNLNAVLRSAASLDEHTGTGPSRAADPLSTSQVSALPRADIIGALLTSFP